MSLREHALLQRLAAVPAEDSKAPRAVVSLPLPDGSFARFAWEESPNMEPALVARYPEIKSYRAVGLDDPTMIARVAWSPRGLRALIATPETAYSVEPVADAQYVSYENASAITPNADECLTEQLPDLRAAQPARLNDVSVISLGGQRRNYRLAMATTYEYTTNPNLGGGTKAKAIASVNEWLNAVNLIYERDLSAHFNLVANNDQLIFDTASDPFSNDGASNQASTMLEQIRTHLNTVIGAANYDVGHLLGVGPSGVAYLGVACVNDQYKGGGVSMIPSTVSVGHPFYIGRIAHELGHQFGTAHTFNDNTNTVSGNCANARSTTQSYESGSGFTIMAYSGSCNAIANDRALHFHSSAIKAIAEFMQTQATCATTTTTGNQPPIVNAGADFRIPKRTPFSLTATANDPDSGDNARLTYSWEQYDAGGTSFGNPSFTDEADPANTTRPIFRPLAPISSPARLFPELTYQRYYQNEPPLQLLGLYVAQHLPRVTRSLNFKVIVRDQRGGVADDDVMLNVDGASGPFQVTAPNTGVIWTGGTQQTVTWSVNNTNNAPISCANVKISLSQDDGVTFPITILSATPNDGSETITVPAGANSSAARLKIEAVGNIFYDISDAAFTINPGIVSCPTVNPLSQTSATIGSTLAITGNNLTGVDGVRFSNNVAATFTVVSNTQINVIVPSGAIAGPITLTKAGCASVQTQTFTPSTCSYSFSAASQNIVATGGASSVNVIAGTGCAWSAISNQAWLTITGGVTGTGNGSVSFIVAPNIGPSRSASITVAGQNFTVIQASGCTFALSAAGINVPQGEQSGSFNVTTPAGCVWTAKSSDTSWLFVAGTATRTGNGTVNYYVSSNYSPSRTATISVEGKLFTVNQADGCNVRLHSPVSGFPAAGGTGTLQVSAGTGCAWRVVSDQPWLTLSGSVTGNGAGTLNFSVSPNINTQRTATITAGSAVFTVTQASGCAVVLPATTGTIAAAGGSQSFAISAGAGCTWTSASDQTWLTIIGGAAGTGNGSVSYAVTPNTGALRKARITVGGKVFTVTQAGVCAISLGVTSTNFFANSFRGGGSSFPVTAPTGCTWSAKSEQPWMTITEGATGSGNGYVTLQVAQNDEGGRVGTVSVSDQTFTLVQGGRCKLTLSSSSLNASAAGLSSSVMVTPDSNCEWETVSYLPWLTVTNGAPRRGSGAVNFTVAPHTAGQPRTGVIYIGNVSFTVTQAAGCQSAVTMTTQSFPATASMATATVTAAAGCAWTASSDQSWAKIESGASGTGNGTVVIKLGANFEANVRQVTITIAGRTFTLTQAVACSLTLATQSVRVEANSGTASVNVSGNPANCNFPAYPDSDSAVWLKITERTSSKVTFRFLENNEFERTSKITVGDKTFTLVQAAKPVNCNGAFFTPTSHNATYTGGLYEVEVSTGMACRWSATTTTPWIVLEAGTTQGIRRGDLGYRLATNPTAQARTGSIVVNGQSFTITQAAAPVCNFGVTPATAQVAANGGTTTLNVTASAGCNWSAVSGNPAARISIGSNGTGNGTVTVVTQPNPAATTRTLSLFIAGQTVTLTQASGGTHNPVPTLRSWYLNEPRTSYKMRLTGHHFLPNSVVRWNGTDRATTYVSSTELEVPINYAEGYSAEVHQIAVFNPPSAAGAGGGLSNTLTYRSSGQVVGISAAGYTAVEGVAPDSIVAIFGQEMATETAIGRTIPLPVTLAGVSAHIYDRDGRHYPMPLFFVSPHQINALIPTNLQVGLAEMQITSGDGTIRKGSLVVQKTSPGLFTMEATGSGLVAGQVLRLRNGAVSYEPLGRWNSTTNSLEMIPIDMGPETDKVFLVLYGTGMKYRSDLSKVSIYASSTDFSDISLVPLYCGAQGSLVGLDQLNLELPRSLVGKGIVFLRMTVDEWPSNTVEIKLK